MGPVATHLARLAADTGHPSRTLWDTYAREGRHSSADQGLDLSALDWAALEVDALTWEFIEGRDHAEARYGFSVYGVDAARMEIHTARRELLADS